MSITNQAIKTLTHKDEYATPRHAFLKIEKEYAKTKFVLDACASKWNAQCKMYITKEQDMFNFDFKWPTFMNPIYGKKGKWTINKGKPNEQSGFNKYGTEDFVSYAHAQHFKHDQVISILLFANTSSSDYIQKYVGETPEDRMNNECEIFLYPNRIRFYEKLNGTIVQSGTPAMSNFVIVYDKRFKRKF